jgi:hypothetical protein
VATCWLQHGQELEASCVAGRVGGCVCETEALSENAFFGKRGIFSVFFAYREKIKNQRTTVKRK